ncbi:hypothetical protein GOP47_0018606 [Adiantum capillus-veneris]|uniref:Uncharacterized protein n=1 Tax=Adiantum capillus-veneris TaxID=13818 RepID=A0A9D4UE44_ADICA|nr:hypothetical protein GOP47_0018606 [Adiantum capillus-veneris]
MYITVLVEGKVKELLLEYKRSIILRSSDISEVAEGLILAPRLRRYDPLFVSGFFEHSSERRQPLVQVKPHPIL